jgi:hypothetical protein
VVSGAVALGVVALGVVVAVVVAAVVGAPAVVVGDGRTGTDVWSAARKRRGRGRSRNPVVEPGQIVELRPVALRYQLVWPPRSQTVPAIFASMAAT